MKQVKLSDDLSLSRVVLGFWRLADWKMSDKELLNYVHEAIELGVDSFDHADIYGYYTCENIFGKILRHEPSLRDQIKLVTKCGIVLQNKEGRINYYNTGKKHITESVNQSLKNLQTDYIDLLLIHRPDPLMDAAEVAEAFTELKKEGKVRNFGVSNFSAMQFDLLNSFFDHKLVTNQIEFSPYQLNHIENADIEFLMKEKIRPMAWSPLAGGKLMMPSDEKSRRIFHKLQEIAARKSISRLEELIYAWILKHPAGFLPILGTSKTERLKYAVNALQVELSREEWFEILVASRGEAVP